MFWKKKKVNKAGENLSLQENETKQALPIKVIIRTDLGNVRTNNEDAAASFKMVDQNGINDKGYLLIVADGMGGHLAGEVASKTAIETIKEFYFKSGKEENKEYILQQAFKAANKKIFELACAETWYRGMGTTCTVAAIVGQKLYYAHAGDSRAYLFKNNQMTRLTEDHTYVQELLSNGVIAETELATHPDRNILTNAMGTKPHLRVDTGEYNYGFEPGDRLLLCSDGLTGYLNDNELTTILASNSLQDCADYCIREAKRRGGMDNITVVLAEGGENNLKDVSKSTREIETTKLTRDADLPQI